MLNVINIIILLYKVLSLTWSASHNQRASLPSGEKNERKRKTASLKVAYWNTRTMQDPEDRPQRHLVLLARELARLDIDIAALSGARFAEQGCFKEDGAGYTPFWSGKNKDERRLSGVRFMIKTSIARKLQTLPVAHLDRSMSLRLPIQDNKFATVLGVFVPNLLAEIGVKKTLYRGYA